MGTKMTLFVCNELQGSDPKMLPQCPVGSGNKAVAYV